MVENMIVLQSKKDKKNLKKFDNVQDVSFSLTDLSDNIVRVKKPAFPTIFRMFFQQITSVPDFVRALVDSMKDNELHVIFDLMRTTMDDVLMNQIFDWDDENEIKKSFQTKLVNGDFKDSYGLQFLVSELIKTYDMYENEKNETLPKTFDLVLSEEEIFLDKGWSSNHEETIRGKCLVKDDNYFYESNYVCNDKDVVVRRFLSLKRMKLIESTSSTKSNSNTKILVEHKPPPKLTFGDQSEFTFEIYMFNPFSRENAFVDFYVVIPQEQNQFTYHIFFNSSIVIPYIQIRKTDRFIENVLAASETDFDFVLEEYSFDQDAMKRIKEKTKRHYHENELCFFDLNHWETLQKDDSLLNMSFFSRFLEQFLSYELESQSKTDIKDHLKVSRELGKVTFHLKDSVELCEMVYSKKDNFHFQFYESAWIFVPMLYNRYKFLHQFCNVSVKRKKEIHVDRISINNFDTLEPQTEMDQFRHSFTSAETFLETEMKQFYQKLEDDLISIMNPTDLNNSTRSPYRTELQFLHFGLLGDCREVLKYIIPIIYGFEIKNSSLCYTDMAPEKIIQMVKSIGSIHYAKAIHQTTDHKITMKDTILELLSQQVDTQIHFDSTMEEKKYIETIQRLRKKGKKKTLDKFYKEYIVLNEAIFNATSLVKNEIVIVDRTPESFGKKRSAPENDDSNLLSTNTKRGRGRPKKLTLTNEKSHE